jgi:hypothetical protein
VPIANVNEVLLSLGGLTRAQLEEVRKRAAFLLQHKVGPAPVEDEDWLLAGILAELRRRGLESRDTFRLKKPASYAGFQTQSENVRESILAATPGLSAVRRRALGEVAARSLADFLASWPVEVNRDNLLRHVGRVTEALDWAFPGYLTAGVLGLVVGKG